ncbi:MAG: hypothetical protein RR365_14945 [Bacteroides sp.]
MDRKKLVEIDEMLIKHEATAMANVDEKTRELLLVIRKGKFASTISCAADNINYAALKDAIAGQLKKMEAKQNEKA